MKSQSKERVLCIIPARGGSKGIPGKNMARIGNRPLIDFTIQAALKADLPGKICLSTDDQNIREYALRAGVEAPFLRPSELARDDSPTIAVIEHAFRWYIEHDEFYPDSILLLQPTCPFRTYQNIIEAYEQICTSPGNSLISVNRAHEHPCEYILADDNEFSYVMDPPQKPGRQNFPEVFFINGAIYLVRSEFFERTGLLYDRHALLYIMSRHESLDIDEPSELECANWFYSRSKELN